MSALTEKQIAAYEARGFKRWTKGNMDRLYIDAKNYGVKFGYNKRGIINGAEIAGYEAVAHEARLIGAAKVYIDLTTGELVINTTTIYIDEIREAVEAIIAEVNDELAAAEKAEEEAAKGKTEEQNVESDSADDNLIWSDFREAIENAMNAMGALANFGICGECEELKVITSASIDELEMWCKGMAILAEQREQHIDRDKVMAAAKHHDALMYAIFNGGGKFDLNK